MYRSPKSSLFNRLPSAAMRLAFLGAALAAAPGLTHADILTVTNASFETLPAGGLDQTGGCPPGCSYSFNKPIDGWTEIAGGSVAFGQLQPGNVPNSMYNDYPSGDGATLAYINGNGYLTQTVSQTIVAGVTYTLQVDIGNPMPFGEVPGTIELLAGDTIGSPILASGTASPASGEWATATITYVSPIGDPNAGKDLTIVLNASDNNTLRTDFDNVRLNDDVATVTATPEPASWLLLAGCALATLGWKHRRQAGLASGVRTSGA